MKSRPRGWDGWLLLGLLAGCGAVLWLQRAWVSEPGWFPERQQRGTALSWERFAGCRLVAYPPNDGDSFKVDTGTGEHVFRLYFVDCPEKQRHPAGGGLYGGDEVGEGIRQRSVLRACAGIRGGWEAGGSGGAAGFGGVGANPHDGSRASRAGY